MLPEELKDVPAVAALEQFDPAAIQDGNRDRGESTLVIAPARIAAVGRFLKDSQQFVRLCSVTAVDGYPMEPRFEVVYHLHSIERNQRLRLKCRLGGDKPEIDSLTGVWKSAGWYEREVFDLFGIVFRGHPDLTRILMPAEWEGHPLRKDYPVHGEKYSYKND